jgi:galactoside O-acetyltransferase
MNNLLHRFANALSRYGVAGLIKVLSVKIGRTVYRRYSWLSTRLLWVQHLAWGVIVEPGVSFSSPGCQIRIGTGSYLGRGCRFICSPDAEVTIGTGSTLIHSVVIGAQREGVRIGNDVMIGEFVSIRDARHIFDDPSSPIARQGEYHAAVVIEDDVWIGRGAIIMAGVHIGKGAVVGANSVVRHDVEPYTVVAGVPARVIKRRGSLTPTQSE